MTSEQLSAMGESIYNSAARLHGTDYHETYLILEAIGSGILAASEAEPQEEEESEHFSRKFKETFHL